MYVHFLGFLLSFVLNTDTAMKFAVIGDYAASNAILNQVKITRDNEGQYCFLKAANAYSLNNKPEAMKWINRMDGLFSDVPDRYRNMASIMEMEIKGWGIGDLGEIGRDMRISKDRLRLGKGGRTTQVVQKEIINKLDKLIEDKETQANGGKGDAEGQPDKAATAANGKSISKPISESIVATAAGEGKVDEKKLRVIADKWGNMPPKERAKVIQDICRDLPARYRVVIEDYFKALSNQTKPSP